MAKTTAAATRTKRPEQASREDVPANVQLGGSTPSLGRRRVKARKIKPEMEQFVERRLGLRNGTTPTEIAADLCNRFGLPWSRNPEEAQNRLEAIAGFVVGFQEWLVENYGDEIRDGNHILIGYGDRVSVEKGHYRKLW